MWFTETPWPPILILSVIGVLLFLGWVSQRKTGYLAGVALCVALCGFVFVLEQQIVTETERVEQRLLDFTAAFQRDSAGVMDSNVLAGLVAGAALGLLRTFRTWSPFKPL